MLSYKDPTTQLVSLVHEYAGGFPDQFPNMSYGIASDGMRALFRHADAGRTNGAGLLGVVEDTKFSVDRGFYDAPFQLDDHHQHTRRPQSTTLPTAPHRRPARARSTPAPHHDRPHDRRPRDRHQEQLPSTNVDTQTYLFLNDIVSQSVQTALAAGYPSTWNADNGTFTADYGFDPDVIGTFDANGNPLGGDLFGGIYADRIKDDLLAIPTISIVLDPNDMFGQDLFGSPDGIYIDPRQDRNPEPERATSIEWITPMVRPRCRLTPASRCRAVRFVPSSDTKAFVPTRVQGRVWTERAQRSPCSMTGPSTSSTRSCCKATANDGYSWNAGQQTLQYARDQFGHSLQQAMGQPSSSRHLRPSLHQRNVLGACTALAERPDNDFAASYLGINPDNWDAIHDNEADSGDFTAWFQMLAQSQAAGSSLTEYMELQGKNLNGTPSPSNRAAARRRRTTSTI